MSQAHHGAQSTSTKKKKMRKPNQFKKRKRLSGALDSEVCFEDLSTRYPEFDIEYRKISQLQQSSGKAFSSLVTQDFNISLTRAFLHDKFALSMPSLPPDRLCPPVPNRLAYVQWIKLKLLPLLSSEEHFEEKTELTHYGIDIGTGASCIYPLLFCASEAPRSKSMPWKIFATDVDALSVMHAKANVAANCLTNNIHVSLVEPTTSTSSSGPLARAIDAATRSTGANPKSPNVFDFVMTNPPFYDDEHSTERTDPRTGDNRTRIPISSNEGSYPGGEVGFVFDILRDSLILKRRVAWYTAMLGKKSSFLRVREVLLQLLGSSCVQETEMTTGQMTRWFIAWTFKRPCLRSPAARVSSGVRHFEVRLKAPSESDAFAEVAERIRTYCCSSSQLNEGCNVVSDVRNSDRAVITICEKDPPQFALPIDGKEKAKPLPVRVSRGICPDWNMHEYLPREGHFVVDFTLSSKTETLGGTRSKKDEDEHIVITVSVSLDCFRHSVRGGRLVEKIRQLEGDVCRTNRRWRRLVEKQQGQAADP